ncbi:Uncharacterized conserved protein [Ceraceosorus bombacis]|uniref:Uncharacterized conserved protein n=1 Tax=Ceraceosorus bombacis TaxID=401625 RepID=A0A0P1BCL9_9BASI|nr:Uncharacterized conserved protein [Ceraceosorus bombacis]
MCAVALGEVVRDAMRCAYTVSLPEECIKAQKILRRMVDPVHGVDGVVPLKVLEKAKGFAIFSVFRLGFRLGGGFNAGADVTDFLIVLNTARAVKAFMSTGSLQLGGNLSVAVGPVGRSAEAAAAVNSEGSAAAMYSYSRSKGVYAGLSVEGTVLLDRSDANSKAYHQSDCSAKKVLSGSVDVPSWALPLHDTVKKFTMTGGADDARSVKDYGGWKALERGMRDLDAGHYTYSATAYAPSHSKPGLAKRLGSFGRSSSHNSNTSREYAFGTSNGAASFSGGASGTASNYASEFAAARTSPSSAYRPASSSGGSSRFSTSPKNAFSSNVGIRTNFKGETSLLDAQSGSDSYGMGTGTGQAGHATYHISNRAAHTRGAGGGSLGFKQQFRNSTSSESADEEQQRSSATYSTHRPTQSQSVATTSQGSKWNNVATHNPSPSLNADPFFASSPSSSRNLASPSGPYALDRDGNRSNKSSSSSSASAAASGAGFVFPRSGGGEALDSPSGARAGAQGWRDDYGLSSPDEQHKFNGSSNGSSNGYGHGHGEKPKRPDMRHRSSSSASRLWNRIRGNSQATIVPPATTGAGYFEEKKSASRRDSTDLIRFEEENTTPPFSPQTNLPVSANTVDTFPLSGARSNFASGAFPSSSQANSDSTTTTTATSPTQQRRVVALYDFEGQEAQDLSFKIGDVIRVIRATMDRQDWWLGRLEHASAGVQGRSGVVGSFPANYTEDF